MVTSLTTLQQAVRRLLKEHQIAHLVEAVEESTPTPGVTAHRVELSDGRVVGGVEFSDGQIITGEWQ